MQLERYAYLNTVAGLAHPRLQNREQDSWKMYKNYFALHMLACHTQYTE
jgi:hypothetical protein